eukprot:scaffold148915_cov18-Tisochrysis_lutea.AAC.2
MGQKHSSKFCKEGKPSFGLHAFLLPPHPCMQSVVCAVGAPENDVLNPLAPKAIDGDGTISLIKESAAAGVERFVLITSLGTEKVGLARPTVFHRCCVRPAMNLLGSLSLGLSAAASSCISAVLERCCLLIVFYHFCLSSPNLTTWHAINVHSRELLSWSAARARERESAGMALSNAECTKGTSCLPDCMQVGWPASILNLFWGVLIWKREAEKALESSGMAYTILRPGGMERPTDSYKETHNLKLSPKNTTFGGQVSRLQVAELVGAVLNNPELSANKWVACVPFRSAYTVIAGRIPGLWLARLLSAHRVLEVTAETTAPRISLEELLQGAAGIKADISPEKQKATREASKVGAHVRLLSQRSSWGVAAGFGASQAWVGDQVETRGLKQGQARSKHAACGHHHSPSSLHKMTSKRGLQPNPSIDSSCTCFAAWLWLQGAAAAVSSGDKRLAAAREELELAMDRIQAANASLAEAKDLEAEVRIELRTRCVRVVDRVQAANASLAEARTHCVGGRGVRAQAAPALKSASGAEAVMSKAKAELEAALQAETTA